MKTLVSLFVALSTAAAAASDFQDVVDQFPECSLECIVAGAEKFDCQVTDIECQCGKMEDITAEVAPCMVKAGCGFEDITGTQPLPPPEPPRGMFVLTTSVDVANIVADLCAGQTTGNLTVDDSEANNRTDEGEAGAAAQLRGPSLVSALVLAAMAAVV